MKRKHPKSRDVSHEIISECGKQKGRGNREYKGTARHFPFGVH